jgi:hypothetical protein
MVQCVAQSKTPAIPDSIVYSRPQQSIPDHKKQSCYIRQPFKPTPGINAWCPHRDRRGAGWKRGISVLASFPFRNKYKNLQLVGQIECNIVECNIVGCYIPN